ncbi:Cl-channel protein [Ceratobasidium theobromae]|uniref:Chloride channel protein n=1 Tax=Ceratobasidium theobromae TaxID=1582974 RepID=A0A5N5QAY8_9AGAM|nr:Cl-channel protein [Ceratobasidium theobromae]
MAVPVPPAFDDTWAQWDDSHPPRTSKDSSQNDPEPAHVPNSPFSTELEMFQSNPWESQLDLSVGRRTYRDGATIDWTEEEAAERIHKHALRSQHGLRGIALPLLDQSRIWMVLIVTGISVGFVGAWLDVLVAWLSDIRTGRCSYGFFYNENSCCSGLDAGEVCNEWKTWSEYYGVRSIAGTSLTQAFTYVVLAILNGYVLDLFLSPWTLLVKGVGLALAVGSGLSLGKEVRALAVSQFNSTKSGSQGPLVHVSCCIASIFFDLVSRFKGNQAQKRRILSAAASAGVAVAFGSPLGGVLFGLEELDLFSRPHVMWRAFVCAALAAVTLQWSDVFATGKLVLFQVTEGTPWRGFELIPWVILSVFGGLAGALLIHLNITAAVYRHHSWIRDWPLMEVVCVTAFTLLSCEFKVPVWLRIYSQNATPTNQTIMDFASPGRHFYAYNHNWGGYGQSSRYYHVIGAAAMLGGVTRMTVSLVVIMFELTGALSHVLPIMIAVMVSKWVGDAFGKEGIYDAWIALHGYPFLSTTVDFRDQGETAASRMLPRERIVSISGHHSTAEELAGLLHSHTFRGFPVVNGDQLVGYLTRDKLQSALEKLAEQYPDESTLSDINCTFVGRHDSSFEEVDLSSFLDPAPMQLRPAMPLQIVVNLFQRMSAQCVLFTHQGHLKGMMTKRDVVNFIRQHFENAHALSERPETIFATN